MLCFIQTAIRPLFLVLFASLVLSGCEGATQDFAVSFSSISNDLLFVQSYGTVQTLVAYRAKPAPSASAMLVFIPASPNTTYVLGAYLFATNGDDTGAILWVANRDRPVSGNFSLSLDQTSGNIVLLDGDGTLAWSTNTSNPFTGPVSMDLETDFSSSVPIGGLFLSDASNNILWQSSKYPTNTLVPSQSLEPGMSLVSWAAPLNPSSGLYRLVMEASGLALYFNGSSLPYWAWSYYGHNDSFGVTHSCGHLIRAYMDPRGILLQNTTTLAPVASNNCTIDNAPRVHEVNFSGNSTSTGSSEMTFLQLFSNGSLIANTLGSERWSFVYDLFGDNKCLIPNYCGPYGVCTAPSTCSCPSNSNGSFPLVFPNNRAQGCPPTRGPPRCSSAANRLELLPQSGADYFATKYSSPLTDFFTMELCQSACLDRCSCLAAFWHSHSNSCFHSGDMRGVQNTLNSSYLAFVKVERPSSSNPWRVIGPILGVVGFFFLALLLAWPWIYRKRRAAKLQAQVEMMLWQSSSLVRYKYKELEFITNGFDKQMGKGGFGTVYAGILKDGTKVAVKRLDRSRQHGENKEFQSEVIILGRLHHCNVLNLIGFCADGPDHKLLVYECMANGSLKDWLSTGDKVPLPWTQRFNIALGAARGLEYLHGECKDTVLHLDIKPENILLDENFVAKIADFGLSKLMSKNESHLTTRTVCGTPGYFAPEWLAERFKVSTKCDVYSFGKVLMEMFSGRRNLDPSLQETDKVYFPAWLYHQITQHGQGLDLSQIAKVETPNEKRQARHLMITAFLCVLEDPAHRPSMERVVHMLEGHVPELEDLELSDLFQGLQPSLRMPLWGLACSRIEEALCPIYQTHLSDSESSSSATGSMPSIMVSTDVSLR